MVLMRSIVSRRTVFLMAASVIVGAGISLAASPVLRLYINGKVASSDLLVRGNKVYAPIRDVATGLGMVVQQRPDGLELIKPGGADQVQGETGKTGDMLFNGKYRFQVRKVYRGQKYVKQFTPDHHEITSYPPGNDVVAVICRIKNGTTKTQQLDILSGKNTALTDDDDHSYASVNSTESDVPDRNPSVLPGAAVDFALMFYVPPQTKLKDLVFSTADFTPAPGPDFRVSVAGTEVPQG